MLLRLDRHKRAPLLAAHFSDFGSVAEACRWLLDARRRLGSIDGLSFAKAMFFIGSESSAGFGAGVPSIRRQILLTGWRAEEDFDAFATGPVAHSLDMRTRHSWWALFGIVSTRGSYYGATPLKSAGTTGEHFAALTLGRARPRTLVRFLREGARLGPFIHGANGLVIAYSAGFPLTGNCTVSLWQSEEHMHRFAYGDPEGHTHTIRQSPPILREQLNARMRIRRVGGDWNPTEPDA